MAPLDAFPLGPVGTNLVAWPPAFWRRAPDALPRGANADRRNLTAAMIWIRRHPHESHPVSPIAYFAGPDYLPVEPRSAAPKRNVMASGMMRSAGESFVCNGDAPADARLDLAALVGRAGSARQPGLLNRPSVLRSGRVEALPMPSGCAGAPALGLARIRDTPGSGSGFSLCS